MSLQFDHIVYGPIHSRRLGCSLGINLLPKHGKICTFDCIYCECGWNKDGRADKTLPTKDEAIKAIENGLRSCKEKGVTIDTITFSGNGEPTLHPDFGQIIDATLSLRNQIFPSAKVSVLSNATQLGREGVKEALSKVDNAILKIDSADENLAQTIDNPACKYSVASVIEQLEWFKGHFVLQTMFLKGEVDGRKIDCSDPCFAEKWIEMVLKLRPREVMMYTLDRVPPLATLEKVSVERMNEIAAPLVAAGIEVIVKG